MRKNTEMAPPELVGGDNRGEIVLYQPEGEIRLEVRVENETATSSILELVQKEGKRLVKRPVTLYNLDMIISVGFRVNTQRGIRFRRWANQVLKDYMLKGCAIRQRKITTDLEIVDRLC